MKLVELLDGVTDVNNDVDITDMTLDSRSVQPGHAFVALAGSRCHGMTYVEEALHKQAAAVLFDPDQGGRELADQVSFDNLIAIPELSHQLGLIAAHFFGRPSAQLHVIGITGTNGKTTCSQWLAQLLDGAVIGTLGWGNPGRLQSTVNTTPDAISIQRMFHDFVGNAYRYVAMEVSSHGLEQGRVNGVQFKGALFTNLSRDHLDYHGTMQAYFASKMQLLSKPDLHYVVFNGDDESAALIHQQLKGKVKLWSFSTAGDHSLGDEQIYADNIDYDLQGIRFDACWRDQREKVVTCLLGRFNIENLLAVLTVLLAEDKSLDVAVSQLSLLQPVAGRMACLGGPHQPRVIIDYAHTPSALEKLLSGIKPLCDGRMILVFGCGGDRDPGKRSQMGAIAADWADQVFITDDNPRMEDPDRIIAEVQSGCVGSRHVSVIHDRQQAIETAITQAQFNDCVVIAGKGHEQYQEISGRRLPFCDQRVVSQALAGWRVACN